MSKKRALFIGIGFYDYEESIKQELIKLNFEVDYFSEVPPNTIKYRFYSRRNNLEKLDQIRNEHAVEVAKKCREDYDFVFIIKAEYLSVGALEIIKKKNSQAKFVLYLWDSLARFPVIKSKFSFFDKIYSFDRLDCLAEKDLVFNPLFFREEYANSGEQHEEKYGIYHLGWCHTNRLALIKKVTDFCDNNDITHKMVLFTGKFSYVFQSMFGGELKGNRKFLIFDSISATQNRDYVAESKSTLDIAHAMQSGLTMRTIELLGMQRKIVTTNKDIINYDFYHPDNVLVIDRDEPILNKAFFESDFHPISQDIVNQYSIENWLERMMNLEIDQD